MNLNRILFAISLISVLFGSCMQANKTAQENQVSAPKAEKKLIATPFNSGFALAHDTYNGISVASNGKIYYVLCSQAIDTGGQMYSFDPKTSKIEHLGDLTEASGEKDQKTIVQGKSHVRFFESGGKLYFATHLGYYSMIDGKEQTGIPTEGFKPYPGGHLLSYDMASGKFENLAVSPNQEGIITMTMDTDRGLIYGLTWPTAHFFRFDLARKEMKDLGPITGEGEKGTGPAFRTVCRSIVVNPADGTAYMTTSEGTILQCRLGQDRVEPVEGENMRKDYFGIYDPSSPGHMGYNWRQAVWYPEGKMIYGVHGNSGYLFRFDPSVNKLEVLERLTSEPSKLSGMFDQFSYGYLGFILGPDGHTLYYLTGGPVYENGKRVAGKSSTSMGEAKGIEDLHLVTYDIRTSKYTDHGAVFYPDGQRPLYVNSIAVGLDGDVYTLARITENNHTRTDLIRIPNPFKTVNQ